MPDGIPIQVSTPQELTPQAAPAADDPVQSEGVQKRIDTLTRRFHDAERDKEALSTQNAALEQKLVEVSNKLDGLGTPPAAPRDDFADLFGSSNTAPRQKPPAARPEDVQAMINNAVQSAIQPLVEQTKADKEANVLLGQQNESFNGVAEYFPELRQNGTEANKLFWQIWEANPDVALSPNGPALVGNAVAGIFQQETRASHNEARKVAASPPTPGSNLNARLNDIPGDQKTKDQNLIQQLTEKGRTREGLTHDEQMALVAIKLGKAHAQ